MLSMGRQICEFIASSLFLFVFLIFLIIFYQSVFSPSFFIWWIILIINEMKENIKDGRKFQTHLSLSLSPHIYYKSPSNNIMGHKKFKCFLSCKRILCRSTARCSINLGSRRQLYWANPGPIGLRFTLSITIFKSVQ